MISRRVLLKQLAAASMAVGGAGSLATTIKKSNVNTKRVIFFLQNQGFDPLTCIPKGLKENCSLSSIELAEPMQALTPFKDKMHIVTGLNGGHTSPTHSAYFGALGGYRGGTGIAPAGKTVDHVLSTLLPQTILPHLCIGMDSLAAMQMRSTIATLSASGASKPIFMHSNPNALYQMLFGSIAQGDLKDLYKGRSSILRDVERLVVDKAKKLPVEDARRFAAYTDGFKEMNKTRTKLASISRTLEKYAPKYDDRYTNPEFETDWHNALLEIGIAALQANVTNVLTIGSGRGEVFGSWKGLGITDEGHSLGHMKQYGNEIWTKIRQYNCQMLVKIMKSLEEIPEGNGTMMDNTIIVYTSNNGVKQHTDGANWPFVLLGNGGGHFKTGQHTYAEGRPLNDLYTTLLRGVGSNVDNFNFTKAQAGLYNSKGLIEGVLS